MRELHIDGTRIAQDEPAYLIAEIGHNHGHDMDKAKRMVFDALLTGANAVKFQTRHPKDVYAPNTRKGAYWFESDNPQWMSPVYGKHREILEFSEDEWLEILGYCASMGITAFSTPFDFKSVDLLERVGVPAYKVASGDATNLPMIRYIAKTGKPTIISTGGCTMEEVDRLVETFTAVHDDLAVLQCSCIYPAPPDVLNIQVVSSFLDRYPQLVTGLSTHCVSIYPTIAAYTLGGRIFEHHFTSDRTWKGTDNHFSLLPEDLAQLRITCDEIREAMGAKEKFRDPRENAATIERRKSLYWKRKTEINQLVTEDDIGIMCPGEGLDPRFYEYILGARTQHGCREGELVQWADLMMSVEHEAKLNAAG